MALWEMRFAAAEAENLYCMRYCPPFADQSLSRPYNNDFRAPLERSRKLLQQYRGNCQPDWQTACVSQYVETLEEQLSDLKVSESAGYVCSDLSHPAWLPLYLTTA
eukprot:scaffold373798_cov18-Prasinocladus_malaysianus.AAC.1